MSLCPAVREWTYDTASLCSMVSSMKNAERFCSINGRELRSRRILQGLTQVELARAAGYTERLIRKAEKGGSLELATIRDLAEALSSPEHTVTVESLTLDHLAMAKQWVEAFDQLEQRMLPDIEHLLADDFEFYCPGEPSTAPFIGTWKGTPGLQMFLDNYFAIFTRVRNIKVEYTVGENSVGARWMESGFMQGIPCGPIRINLHFSFVNGLIARIDDDYDTQAGAIQKSNAETTLQERRVAGESGSGSKPSDEEKH